MSVASAPLPGDAAWVRWRPLVLRVLLYGVLAAAALFYLAPALVIISNIFRSSPDIARDGLIALPRSFSFAPFVHAWNDTCVSGTCAGIKANFFNSLKITIPATLITTALGAVNGYILSKWRFRGDTIVFAAMIIGVFLPPQTALLPWAFILSRIGLYNSFYGLILIHCVQGIAFTTLFCRSFFMQVPDEILKAARLDGAGFWRIFGKIMLPLSPPILIVTVIWQFTSIWNEYLYGMVFTAGTEQPVTAALMSAGHGSQSATVLIAALPPLLIFLFGGRFFVRELTRGALAGT